MFCEFVHSRVGRPFGKREMEGPIDLDQLNSFIRIGDKRAFDTTLKGSVGRQLLPLDQVRKNFN